MNARHIASRSNPRRRTRNSSSARDLTRSSAVGALRVANENCVSLASETRVTLGVRLAGGDVPHRLERRRPVREQVAEDHALAGQPVHVDRRLGDDPQPPLAAEDHLAHARPGRGLGHRARRQHAARHHDPHRARQVGDVAVLVGLHARRARRDPAAERRVREAVGEVPERPAAGVELLLEPGAERAGLHAREPGRLVDREHAVDPPHVDRDDRSASRPRAARGCPRCSSRRRTGSRPRRRRSPPAAPPPPRPRRPGARRRPAAGRARRAGGGRGRAGSCRARARGGRADRSRRARRRPPPRASARSSGASAGCGIASSSKPTRGEETWATSIAEVTL